MHNPFYGFGSRVHGPRLVGRSDDVHRLSDYLGTQSGSLSLIGLGKIGKSSLAQAIVEEIVPKSRQLTYSWLTLSTIPAPADVFWAIIDVVTEWCRDHDALEALDYSAQSLSNQTVSENDLYVAFRHCRRTLRGLARAGIKSFVVLDEFDAVRDYPNARLFLQQVRELIDFREETGFIALTISRRSLYHLERQVSGISNLDGVCEKHFVGPLPRSGMREMLDRCGPDWICTEADLDLLQQQTGGHPFLAEMILCRAWEARSVEAGSANSRVDLFGYYEHVREVLMEDGIFDQLLQATVGPIFKLNLEAIERLIRYGILRQPAELTGLRHRGWSEPFQLYLERTARDAPLWSMWRDTEEALRGLIKEICMRELGVHWLEKLTTRHANISRMMDGEPGNEASGCRERMRKERKNFGLGASEDVLDYTYPMDLWAIISVEWSWFQKSLARDKAYWNERFSLLAKVRTPAAHNREDGLPEYVLTTAKAYCQEILTAVRRGSGADDSSDKAITTHRGN